MIGSLAIKASKSVITMGVVLMTALFIAFNPSLRLFVYDHSVSNDDFTQDIEPTFQSSRRRKRSTPSRETFAAEFYVKAHTNTKRRRSFEFHSWEQARRFGQILRVPPLVFPLRPSLPSLRIAPLFNGDTHVTYTIGSRDIIRKPSNPNSTRPINSTHTTDSQQPQPRQPPQMHRQDRAIVMKSIAKSVHSVIQYLSMPFSLCIAITI
ncbi:hypothetical protein BC829DRAFT_202341 [Chytridium lagenaria]|nr:hypothetical protein BC829DRAFT_202341 [Chytridium lagenaria]